MAAQEEHHTNAFNKVLKQMQNSINPSGVLSQSPTWIGNSVNMASKSASPKNQQEELRFTIDKVANGYVLRLAGGYGELVSPNNTFIASDIKELGDLVISVIVNNQLGK
jgi:hypothetical protein